MTTGVCKHTHGLLHATPAAVWHDIGCSQGSLVLVAVVVAVGRGIERRCRGL
jgi:hypothetical protein